MSWARDPSGGKVLEVVNIRVHGDILGHPKQT